MHLKANGVDVPWVEFIFMDSELLFPIQNMILGHGIGFLIFETVETMKEVINQACFWRKLISANIWVRMLTVLLLYQLSWESWARLKWLNDYTIHHIELQISCCAEGDAELLNNNNTQQPAQVVSCSLKKAFGVRGQTYVSRLPDILKCALNFKCVQWDTKAGQLCLYYMKLAHRMYWVELALGSRLFELRSF